jgi:hypothetical protein
MTSRMDIFWGRYRESFETTKAIKPNTQLTHKFSLLVACRSEFVTARFGESRPNSRNPKCMTLFLISWCTDCGNAFSATGH